MRKYCESYSKELAPYHTNLEDVIGMKDMAQSIEIGTYEADAKDSLWVCGGSGKVAAEL